MAQPVDNDQLVSVVVQRGTVVLRFASGVENELVADETWEVDMTAAKTPPRRPRRPVPIAIIFFLRHHCAAGAACDGRAILAPGYDARRDSRLAGRRYHHLVVFLLANAETH